MNVGRAAGGRIVPTGTPEKLSRDAHSATTRHLRDHLASKRTVVDSVAEDSWHASAP